MSRSSSRHLTRCRALSLELLESRAMLSLTGDAPPDYPSAQVTSSTGPILGVSRTVDDGIFFGPMRVGQLGATLSVTVANGSNARLDGWIDFNGDESFSGPGEQIFDGVAIGTGANQTLRFDIPAWAVGGTTYARFRIATALTPDDGLGQGGNQSNGEVEDYVVEIFPPRAGSGDFGAERIVTQASGIADGPVDLITGNFNRTATNPGDVAMEIVTSSHIDGEIAIYRANGTFTSWTRTVIYNGADNPMPEEPTAIGLAAGDLDGDGDLDLVSASANDDTIAWYRNGSTASSFSFTRFQIAGGAAGARAVEVADFDRDGRLDIVSVSLEDGIVRVHRNTGNTNGALTFETLVAVDVSAVIPGLEGLADVCVGDFDDDGWIDFATVEAATNRVVWYRNDTTPFTGVWNDRRVAFNGTDTTLPNASGVFAVDMDGDLDLDLMVTFLNEGRVDWFANNGSGTFSNTRNAVASGLDLPYPAYAADIDGDGDKDVLIPNSGDDQLLWRRNSGSGAFSAGDTIAFTTPTNVAISDIDGDGALDILAGSDTTDRVSWWQNPYSPPEIVIRGGGQIIADEDNSPRSDDGTQFGSVAQGGTALTKTFVIHNEGTGVLNVYGVTVPEGFTLTLAPASTVAPGGQTSFQVRLNTAIAGEKSGEVVVETDDADESLYNFQIEGLVVALAPEIEVRGNNVSIADGDTTPTSGDHTHFGTVDVGGTPVVRTFTIRNTGEATLSLGSVGVTGAGFTVVAQPATSVAPGGMTTFQIRLDTAIAGTKNGTVAFTTNDPNEATFDFSIRGVVAIGLPGDYNDDGEVDAADYVLWRNTVGSTTDLRANGDDTGASQGVIDGADYVVWKNNFGASSASISMAPNEPATTAPLSKPVVSTRRSETKFAAISRSALENTTDNDLLLYPDFTSTPSSRESDPSRGDEHVDQRAKPAGQTSWGDAIDVALGGLVEDELRSD